MKKFGRFVFNFFWVLLIGIESAITNFILGVSCCVTIIGIPLGLQYLKFIKLSFAPAGKVVATKYSRHPVLNTLWLIFGGLEMMILYWILGVLLTITIIGRPLAIQLFKIAKFNAAPFGCEILKEGEYSQEKNLLYDYNLLARRFTANPNVVIGSTENGSPKTVYNYIRERSHEARKIVEIEEKAAKVKSMIIMAAIMICTITSVILTYKILDLILYGIGNLLIGFGSGIIIALLLSIIMGRPKKETMTFYETNMRDLMQYYPVGSKEKDIPGIGQALSPFTSLVYVVKQQ